MDKMNSYTLGKCDYNGNNQKNCVTKLTWELKEKDGKTVFSMCGEIWQPNGRDILAGGQCVDTVASLFPNDAKMQRMAEIWQRWHLNDMRPGCEHQRGWDTGKPATVTTYTWGDAFHRMRKAVESAAATVEEYADFQKIKPRVYAVTIGFNTPKWETSEIKELLAAGLIKAEKTETKTAGWVSAAEHPEGLLSKPCPACGYKYGSSWLYEEIPADVLAEIRSW